MGKILVIHSSDFSQNRIDKVDITKQVENSVDSQNPSSSTVSVNNLSLKIIINNNDCSKQI